MKIFKKILISSKKSHYNEYGPLGIIVNRALHTVMGHVLTLTWVRTVHSPQPRVWKVKRFTSGTNKFL